jgi:5'-3' exonuclease
VCTHPDALSGAAQVRPRLTVAAFDSGARKAAPRGSVDARRAARAGGGAAERRGDPRPLAAALAALRIPSCVAPPGAQGDDVLASLAAVLSRTRLRCLVASGDADVQAALSQRVAWLRVAPHASSAHPAVLELVTWQSFRAQYGFEPRTGWPVLGALRGRPRDGVPRCRGVGDRAAAGLVRAHGGDVEAILAAAGAALRLLPLVCSRWSFRPAG